MADFSTVARSRDDPGGMFVGLLCLEPRDSGPARPQRKSQRHRFSTLLYSGLACGGPPWRRFVRHECAGCTCGATGAGSRGHPVFTALPSAGFHLVRAAGSFIVWLGATALVGLQRVGLWHLLLWRLESLS